MRILGRSTQSTQSIESRFLASLLRIILSLQFNPNGNSLQGLLPYLFYLSYQKGIWGDNPFCHHF